MNSVSQLSDVKPTDWAFQALQSLVERYGCIVGYPDGTYRGNRAITRYEFAAGLNSCLDRVSELIAAGTTNLITREDLAIVQKLQAEFATELSVLRGRVDALDARTAELEANQFSPTTKMNAEIIVVVTDTSGNSVGDSRDRADIVYGAIGISFPDVGGEGNLPGILVGLPARVTSSNVRRERDTSAHFDTFF